MNRRSKETLSCRNFVRSSAKAASFTSTLSTLMPLMLGSITSNPSHFVHAILCAPRFFKNLQSMLGGIRLPKQHGAVSGEMRAGRLLL